MANTFNFEIDSDPFGTQLLCDGRIMTPDCLMDSEVDHEIGLLKRQLDEAGRRMKRAIRESAKKPIEFVQR